jgi:hypothetical protein
MKQLLPTKTEGTKRHYFSKRFGKFSIEWKGGLGYLFEAEKNLYKVLTGIFIQNKKPENLKVYE